MKSLLLLAFISSFSSLLIAQPADTSRLLAMEAPGIYTVQMNTSMGSILVEVHKEWAPLAATRFYQLVSSGYYNNSRLFRSNTKYLQFGIANDSAVNDFWDNHPIADEPVIQKNTAGTLSFATAGPGTRTSSVYFNKINNPKLDTIQNGTAFPGFGKVVHNSQLLGEFKNRYVDSVVFRHWDAMTTKGNKHTDKVLPNLDRIFSMYIVPNKYRPAAQLPAKNQKRK